MSDKPLKLILWEDAYNGDHGWVRVSELPAAMRPTMMATVGFEIARTPERVTLAMSLQQDFDDPQVCDLFTIPVGMIRSEKRLK